MTSKWSQPPQLITTAGCWCSQLCLCICQIPTKSEHNIIRVFFVAVIILLCRNTVKTNKHEFRYEFGCDVRLSSRLSLFVLLCFLNNKTSNTYFSTDHLFLEFKFVGEYSSIVGWFYALSIKSMKKPASQNIMDQT